MLKDENLNSLAGALRKDKQSNLNPALKNIQSGIYHAITVPGIDPEGRAADWLHMFLNWAAIQIILCIFNMLLLLVVQMTWEVMDYTQCHHLVVLRY